MRYSLAAAAYGRQCAMFFDKVYKEPAQNLRALCLEALYPS